MKRKTLRGKNTKMCNLHKVLFIDVKRLNHMNKTRQPVLLQPVNTLPVFADHQHKLLFYKAFEHALSIKCQQRSILRMRVTVRFLVTIYPRVTLPKKSL